MFLTNPNVSGRCYLILHLSGNMISGLSTGVPFRPEVAIRQPSQGFDHRLNQLRHQIEVDVIEVIGHTDERPVASGLSNLDRQLSSTAKASEWISPRKSESAMPVCPKASTLMARTRPAR